LSCKLIVTVLDRQAERYQRTWNTREVMNALSETTAFFCNELYAHHGPAAVGPSGGPEEQIHALVVEKLGLPQHRGAPTLADAWEPAPRRFTEATRSRPRVQGRTFVAQSPYVAHDPRAHAQGHPSPLMRWKSFRA
jgi:hypothetical protein